MALELSKNNDDTTMSEVIKQERIAKIESRIKNNDRQTIKAVLEWINNDKKVKKVKKVAKKKPLNFDEI
jgi:hypothetical protein